MLLVVFFKDYLHLWCVCIVLLLFIYVFILFSLACSTNYLFVICLRVLRDGRDGWEGGGERRRKRKRRDGERWNAVDRFSLFIIEPQMSRGASRCGGKSKYKN